MPPPRQKTRCGFLKTGFSRNLQRVRYRTPALERPESRMKIAGILLLLSSVVLIAAGVVAPVMLSFAAIASAEAPLRPETLGKSLYIPLVCLPAAVLAAVN